jgi:hypothetical protein
MISRKLVALALLAVFAMSAAFVGTGGINSVPTAQAACSAAELAAGTCVDITTTATVNGSVAAPRIECKWELPDMDLVAAGMQYADVENPGPAVDDHDDDITKGPTPGGSTTPGTPCALATSPVGPPIMANGAVSMIQVKAPNHLQNTPVPVRTVELWAAVDHASGPAVISDVFWDVYQPCPNATLVPNCGSSTLGGANYALKVQVHWNSTLVQERDGKGQLEQAWARGGGRLSANDGNCDSYGTNTTTDGTMWNAAVETGQLTASAVEDATNGMLALCRESRKAIYHATIELTKDEPCGSYKVVATAVAAGGNFITLTNSFDVLCNVFLEADFTTVNWGTVVPGFEADVAGDTNFGTGGPTLANGNNAAMGVTITYGPMTGATNFTKVIDKFDVAFGRTSSNLNRLGYTSPFLNANTTYDLSKVGGSPTGTLNPAWVLCANELGKIDFSLHPDATLPNDVYNGSLTIRGYLAEAVPNICYGNLHAIESQ